MSAEALQAQLREIDRVIHAALHHPVVPSEPHIAVDEAALRHSGCPADVAKLYPEVLQLYRNPEVVIFHEPVNALRDGLFDYYDRIRRPMSLRGVLDQIVKGKYAAAEEVLQDMKLMFQNCIVYNGAQSPFGKLAEEWQRRWVQSIVPLAAAPPTPTPATGSSSSSNKGGAAPAKSALNNNSRPLTPQEADQLDAVFAEADDAFHDELGVWLKDNAPQVFTADGSVDLVAFRPSDARAVMSMWESHKAKLQRKR